MKKIAALFLAAVTALSMAGCAKEEGSGGSADKDKSSKSTNVDDSKLRPVMKEFLDRYDEFYDEHFTKKYSEMVDEYIKKGVTDLDEWTALGSELQETFAKELEEWLDKNWPEGDEYEELTEEETKYMYQIAASWDADAEEINARFG